MGGGGREGGALLSHQEFIPLFKLGVHALSGGSWSIKSLFLCAKEEEVLSNTGFKGNTGFKVNARALQC